MADQSPAAAARSGQVIQAGTKRLADFAEIGQPMTAQTAASCFCLSVLADISCVT
ncbi:hypothetical protein KEF85_05540 [Methylomonas paludis]|uniref:Uncharacterized protein n=1 Tax=Methylomonas paludis TaxID=1173101 RepID=A0A975MR00_9GAMM|nr:hypothetical protein [Methylomonas paludis]QWF71921.1 hypothetical protein KEF85_05540 [Methylomonas paludis]